MRQAAVATRLSAVDDRLEVVHTPGGHLPLVRCSPEAFERPAPEPADPLPFQASRRGSE
jgi:hypothetical protein